VVLGVGPSLLSGTILFSEKYFVFREYGFPKLEMNNVLKKILTVANVPVAKVNILTKSSLHL
jgi:hypothetical protein